MDSSQYVSAISRCVECCWVAVWAQFVSLICCWARGKRCRRGRKALHLTRFTTETVSDKNLLFRRHFSSHGCLPSHDSSDSFAVTLLTTGLRFILLGKPSKSQAGQISNTGLGDWMSEDNLHNFLAEIICTIS